MNQMLYVRDSAGEFVQADSEAIVEAARAHLRRRMRGGAILSSPKLMRDFLTVTLGERGCEYFCVLLLDLCGAPTYVEQTQGHAWSSGVCSAGRLHNGEQWRKRILDART